jgi:FRG domain/SET domain
LLDSPVGAKQKRVWLAYALDKNHVVGQSPHRAMKTKAKRRLASTASTISEFLRIVKDFRKPLDFRDGEPWRPWFRGHSVASWRLSPKLYRDYGGYDFVRREEIEDEIREEFITRAPILCDGLPANDEMRAEWDWYFTMQHFGTPTRLLDWTDGALIALFFAVKDNAGFYDAAVWMLDPYALNRQAVAKRIIGPGWIIPPSACGVGTGVRKEINRWLPERFSGMAGLPKKPVAIYPSHTQRRISTQRSCFTIHGTDELALDKLYISDAQCLAKITIPAACVQAIRRDLDSAGIDEATIFPDLGGLSRTIMTRWKPDGHPHPHLKVYGRLRPSKIHGVGVFAIVNIKKGTPLFIGENPEMPWFDKKTLPRNPREVWRLYQDFAVIDDRNGRYGCPTSFNRLNPSWYLNEPRVGEKANVDCDSNTYEFRAMRNIKAGEELTVAYKTYSDLP